MPALTVMIVEDSATFVRGLQTLLEMHNEFVVSGSAPSGPEALALAASQQPELALVDLRIRGQGQPCTPDFHHGLDAITRLRSAVPGMRILAMSSDPNAHWPVEAVRAGASGFISKDAEPEAILAALRTIARGDVVLTSEQLARTIIRPPTELSERELQVLRLLAQGLTNREVAERLSISEGTARTHVEHILDKFGVNSRRDAVAEGNRRGLC